MPPRIQPEHPLTFVDSSVWFAAAVKHDADNARAKAILKSAGTPVTTDHVIVETWLMLNSTYGVPPADRFSDRLRTSGAKVETVLLADLEMAEAIGKSFRQNGFSLVDRTSIAVMQRLGLYRVASFGHHFARYRYGPPSRMKRFDLVG